MIEMNCSTALMVYLCFTMGVLLLFWTITHYLTRKQKIICVEEEIVTCEYCQFSYLKNIGKAISKCPQCHSYNNESG